MPSPVSAAVLHNYRCFSYGMNYEKRALGEKYKDKRNWREYNEKLVARGEAYISLDFIETWDKDLEKLNRGKVGICIS